MDLGDLARSPYSPGRVSGLLAFVFLLFLPIASCGPVVIKGHHIVLNQSPMEEGRDELFEEEHGYMRNIYFGSMACAAVAAIVPQVPIVCAVTGLGGAALLITFLLRLGSLAEEDGASINWETGAYLAFLAFAGVLAQAALLRAPPSHR